LIEPSTVDKKAISNPRSLNVALLGVLSKHLDIEESIWMDAVLANLPEKIHEINKKAFAEGRKAG
ncbi:MAG: 2-oxoacid:acceptor oxidoreductase family protein, partial [Candidatus Hinthialibacter sp.]